MAREILSTERPSRLRLAGFVCLAAGAVLAGVGATRDWAVVGFPQDVQGATDLPFRGTDVWEGKAVLLAAFAALLGILAMRLAATSSGRRTVAAVLVALGLACIALPLSDAFRATDRFGGTEGIEIYTQRLAAELDEPVDVVRDQLSELVSENLRVDVASGLWLSGAGGVLLLAGGALSWAWAGRRAREANPG